MKRSHYTSQINNALIGQQVQVLGWVNKVRNLGALVFVDLRDTKGLVQINIDPELFSKFNLKNEFCVGIKGLVQKRVTANNNMENGDVEIVAEDIQIFSKSELTPFIIADETDALEDTRLKYRYLDLRRPTLQKNLKLRAKIVKTVHEYLDSHDFNEIETPMLNKTTPEGAREYLVPSRTRPGHFYALPQSPQIFKQLLMIAGFDKYYQVARCFRDEDLRADRQPEFTQIDMETSFLEQEDIFVIVEGLMKAIFKETINVDIETPFKQITYRDCLDTYGTDKPDTRFGMHIHDLTSILSYSTFEAFKDTHIKGIKVEGVAQYTSRKTIDELNVLAKKMGVHGVTVLKYENDQFEGSFIKFLTPTILEQLKNEFTVNNGDILVFGADHNQDKICFAIGSIRSKYGKELGLLDSNIYNILWVVDWPLFDKTDDGQYVILHHPFTRPRDEDKELLYSAPEKVLSRSYDLVCNGYELSSGSLRIYDKEMQRRVFEIIGFSDEEIKNRFGFFIDAFNYGTPPHGGLAIGLERLTMILAHTDNIRDVVSFPKNLNAVCPMSDAPSIAPSEAIDMLGIDVTIKGEK